MAWGVRAMWREDKPSLLVVAGCAIAFVSLAVFLAYLVATETGDALLPPAAVTIASLVLCFPTAGLVLGGDASTRRFVLVGVFATPIALLTAAGVVGGCVALAGVVWGIIRGLGGPPA